MRTFAKTADQGTAAAETGLCLAHDSPERRTRVEQHLESDVTGPWVETTDNLEVHCQVCGRSGSDDDTNLRTQSERAARMNAAGKIEQEVYEGDDLFTDLGI